MLKFWISISVFAGLLLSSCIKHEVIPAPVPQVELYAHFIGNVGGDVTEFTQNVEYYDGISGVNYEENFGIANTKYYFNLASTTQIEAMGVMLGSITWNVASGNTSPALSTFNQFFLDNTTPDYKDNANDGFQVMYTDVNGLLWKSSETSTNPQTVIFKDIFQESDSEGDYSKFTCEFSCYVYADVWDDVLLDYYLDSIHIQDAVLKGWFKR